MRKVKIVTIEGVGEVTVKEVSPLAVYRAMSADNKLKEITVLLEECVVFPKGKDGDLYASEIEAVVDAFLEVNSSFLAIMGKLKLKTTMIAVVKAAMEELSMILPDMFAGSFRLAMEKMPGIMDGDAS